MNFSNQLNIKDIFRYLLALVDHFWLICLKNSGNKDAILVRKSKVRVLINGYS